MAELFLLPRTGGGSATRQAGHDIRLEAPSDIYFGPTTPGIAYYEKSGADLQVTLLNSEEVTVRNFFGIGDDGAFSRLLKGPGGAVEATGLLAPEPFEPRSSGPLLADHAPAEQVIAAQPAEAAARSAAPAEGALVVQEGAVQPGAAAVQASDHPGAVADGSGSGSADGSGGGFFGVPVDTLLFAGLSLLPAIAMLGSRHSSGGSDDDPAAATDTARLAAADETGMDASVVALLTLDAPAGDAAADEDSTAAETATGADIAVITGSLTTQDAENTGTENTGTDSSAGAGTQDGAATQTVGDTAAGAGATLTDTAGADAYAGAGAGSADTDTGGAAEATGLLASLSMTIGDVLAALGAGGGTVSENTLAAVEAAQSGSDWQAVAADDGILTALDSAASGGVV